mmetsp:Transcript_16044/g.41284  ORF Transcript_16044/g.41284 Transcript_16044/m.41284 type:complete len:213 (-) Transcript_16044:139-777(-)
MVSSTGPTPLLPSVHIFQRYLKKLTEHTTKPRSANCFSTFASVAIAWSFSSSGASVIFNMESVLKVGTWMMKYPIKLKTIIWAVSRNSGPMPTPVPKRLKLPGGSNLSQVAGAPFGRLYLSWPVGLTFTRPAYMAKNHGNVSNMMVLPASAPTPTVTCSCALLPRPEKSTIIPSGTAPSTGSTMLPTKGAHCGTNSRSSEPSLIRLEASNNA